MLERGRRVGSVLAGVLALAALPGAEPAAAGDPAAVRARLLLLPANGCDVRYTPGSLDRAATAQVWLCELAAGGARATRRPAPLQALVLTREEWTESGVPCAYGVPCVAAPGVLALPSAGDPGTVELWRAALGALPTLAGSPFVGTPEEVASLAPADAFASALAARELVAASGFAAEEPWVLDLLGHLLFLDAARRGGEGRDEALAGFWLAVLRRGPQPSSAAAGALPAELHRQATLFVAARAIAGTRGGLPAKRLRRLQEDAGGILRVADLRAEWPAALASLDELVATGPQVP
jgi:hypothetical protein